MRKLLLFTVFAAVQFLSCNPSSSTDESLLELEKIQKIFKEFDIYTSDGKLGNDTFGQIFRPFTEFVTPLETKSFFDYRNSIQSNYGKMEFNGPLDSISIENFLKICLKNPDGGVIFNMRKNQMIIGTQIVGIKKYESNLEVDEQIMDSKDTLEYRRYGRQARLDKKVPYQNFHKKPFIYLDKQATISVLKLMDTTYGKTRNLYFYYGYSRKSVNEPYHPSILFSIHKDLEKSQDSHGGVIKYAFANRGGLCCPPQY